MNHEKHIIAFLNFHMSWLQDVLELAVLYLQVRIVYYLAYTFYS